MAGPDFGGGSPSGRNPIGARLNYVELPAAEIARSKAFFEAAFGWSLCAFGPTYAATTTGDVDLGLQGDGAQAGAAPLPVIEVDDLERALEAVKAAGGEIMCPIFSFPGGRRFHLREPSGNEIAVSQVSSD